MWAGILGLGLKLLGWYLDKKKANAELRRAFLQFVEQIEKQQMGARDLNESSRKQIADIIAKEKAAQKK